MTPSVTITVTMNCLSCGARFEASGRRRYCSDACKQHAWRQRHLTPRPPQPHTTSVAIVYECPGCDTRYIDERRCPDCNLFCRRLGPGAPCPHCDEPVTITDLFPQAAS